MRYILSAVLVLSIVITSCDKYKNYDKVVVVDTKNVATGGCGFVLKFEDGTQKKPQSLPTSYQSDGIKLKIKAHDAGSVICHTDSTAKNLPLIELDDVVRDLD